MFEKTKEVFRDVTNKIFGRNQEMTQLGQENKIDNRTKVKEWVRIYEDKPYWRSTKVRGSNLPAAMVSELSKKATVELGSSEFLKDGFEAISAGHARLVSKTRNYLEQLLVQGSALMIPMDYEDRNGKITIEVNFVPALNFKPIRFNEQDELVEVEVYELAEHNGVTYTRVETHLYDRYERSHTMINKLFKGDLINFYAPSKGKELLLSTVPEFSELNAEVVVPNVDKPLFVYVKTPFTNNVNSNSPLGVSLYAKVESLLREYDEAYTVYITELKGKKVRIDAPYEVAEGIIENEPGDSVLRDIIYPIFSSSAEEMPELVKSGLLGVYSPDIREAEFAAGMEKLLRQIERNAGFSYGELSEVNFVAKTATEVKMGKQTTYATVEDIQKSYDKALRDIAEAMFELAKFYEITSGDFDSDSDLSIDWGDGVTGDDKGGTDVNLILSLIDKGLLKQEIGLSKILDCSVEEALLMMPSLSQTTESSGKPGGFEDNKESSQE